MIFVDASFYLSLLKTTDSNHTKASQLAKIYGTVPQLTSYAVLGEVATVGSQRYNKEATIAFIEGVLQGTTMIVLESKELVTRAWEIFKNIKSKNVSWVDCYSWVIMKEYKIEKILTFDRDFHRLLSAKQKA